MSLLRSARAAALATHPGPTVVVTTLAGLLGRAAGLDVRRMSTLVGAVLSAQLTIGWSNDLIDAGRDRATGRTDKPLATGELSPRVAVGGLVAALGTCGILSARLGRRAGLVHGVLVVGSGWAYNLGLKRTLASFAPYAVAFGALPQVPTLSARPPRSAPLSRSLAGALLGVGAHLLNALPDLDADRATGVAGLPHRMTPRALKVAAALCLMSATRAGLRGTPVPRRAELLALAASAGLGAGVATGRGKVPFYCAAGCAIIDAAALVAGSKGAIHA